MSPFWKLFDFLLLPDFNYLFSGDDFDELIFVIFFSFLLLKLIVFLDSYSSSSPLPESSELDSLSDPDANVFYSFCLEIVFEFFSFLTAFETTDFSSDSLSSLSDLSLLLVTVLVVDDFVVFWSSVNFLYRL